MAMETQWQIRQNALEVQDYFKELREWEKDVKKKEKGLAKGLSGESNAPSAAPAPRGRAHAVEGAAPAELQRPALGPGSGKKSSAKASASTGKASKPAAAHTYSSYKKWDAFDVDAALAESSDDEGAGPRPAASAAVAPSQPQPPAGPQAEQPLLREVQTHRVVATGVPAGAAAAISSSGTAAAAAHPPIRGQQVLGAEGWRSRGNELFKIGEWQEAKRCYSASIDVEPSCLGYANRAMAELKLGEHQSAEADCTAALALDASYAKAYLRRGAARKALSKLQEALADFEAALLLEPTNAGARADRDACLAAYLKQHKLRPLTKRDKLPVAVSLPAPAPAPPAPAAAPISSAAAATPAAPGPGAPAPAPQAAAAASPPSVEAASAAAAPQPPPADAAPASASPASAKEAQREATVSAVAASAAAAAEQAAARATQQAVQRPPKTSTEFESMWRSLRGDADLQLAYLKLIPPADCASIFKSSLTAATLTSVLGVLLRGVSADASCAPHAAGFLQALTRVARFDMTAMSIPGREKAGLKEAWAQALAACSRGEPGAAQQLAELQRQYRLA